MKILYLCVEYETKTYTIILKGSITLFGLLQTYCRYTFFSDRIISV